MGTRGLGGVEAVGHVELRNSLPQVVERVSRDETVALTSHNRIEAYIVAPSKLADLADAHEQLARMRSTVPILVAALRNRIAYPAEALRALVGSDLEVDWRRMNAFQATFPTETTHDEDGHPLPEQRGGLRHEPIAELDDELSYRA